MTPAPQPGCLRVEPRGGQPQRRRVPCGRPTNRLWTIPPLLMVLAFWQLGEFSRPVTVAADDQAAASTVASSIPESGRSLVERSTGLLIVGADEAGCAAAVQAARLGVPQVLLINDLDWLGGQFCTQGIGPLDEWTLVDGRRVNFPRSGQFLEIVERIRAHNRRTYGVAAPGNGWCGSETIEPKAAAQIFEDWLAPYGPQGTGQLTILRRLEPTGVLVANGAVVGVDFRSTGDAGPATLRVYAKLTIDASDWGDVIRLSGAEYMAGPDLRSRFGEPSAPERLEADGHQEMNPISWCPVLRETAVDAVIPRPAGYDRRSFADWEKAPPWVDWDGSGGLYNPRGWSIYTHRRLVDRVHFGFPTGTEVTVLNWPAHDYPLSTLPEAVRTSLEQLTPGASRKNIVDMSTAERQLLYAAAKERALEFLYWLQTDRDAAQRAAPIPFRRMALVEDFGTPDRLPPKPYIREGLRLVALHVLREQDVRTAAKQPMWAKAMVPDGVFGYQFNMDFHPTRRQFATEDRRGPWQPRHQGTRNWNADTDRAMFPLRGLIPQSVDGLLGCSKNIGVTSMVQSSLRLQGQMMHVGTAAGTVAALALKDELAPRQWALNWEAVERVQRILVRGAGGPGTLIWPWDDLTPDDPYFEAANLLTLAGIWRPDPDRLEFRARQVVTRRELATTLVRWRQSLSVPLQWPSAAETSRFSDVPPADPDRRAIEAFAIWTRIDPQVTAFRPSGETDAATLQTWLTALGGPTFSSLTVPRLLTRGECVDYLQRARQASRSAAKQESAASAPTPERRLPNEGSSGVPFGQPWLVIGADSDGDGLRDEDDALPWDGNNNRIPDQLEPPF